MFMSKMKTTEAIEKERLQLWNDYQTYQEVEQSANLKTYLALKEKVESKPFLENKKEIESLRFKGSPEEKMLKEFGKLSSNRKLKLFFATESSPNLDRYQTIVKSGVLLKLKELEDYVNGGSYRSELVAFKRRKKADKTVNEKWENTEAFSKKKEYTDLLTSPNVVFSKKFAQSKAYKNYLAITDSALLSHFKDLKDEAESEKFITRKSYLENLKRYEDTDDYQDLVHFQKLDKDPKIQLYLKYNETDAFKFFREWTTNFHENFATIDPKIWKYVTPIAKDGPGKNFSMKNQLHYANKSDNFNFENSILTLETQKEKIEGLYWDEKFGFLPKVFNYTSGIIHTVDGFLQEYGLFEIKVKSSKVKGVISSVSLVNADEEICIRIYSSTNGNAVGGLITTNHQEKIFSPVKLKTPYRGYQIIQLHWTREKLEWKVNDKVMGSITANVPHFPLGLRIESEVLKETQNLPHRLDIDWIKCYKAST